MSQPLPAHLAARSPGPARAWRAAAVALSVALTLGLAAPEARAVSLGRITVQSALGEPLRAEIDIPQITPDEVASLRTALASPEAFRAAGIERNPALADLRISLQQRPGGGYFLRLSLPERHAGHIKPGDEVIVGSRGMTDLGKDAPLGQGKVVKVYPEIASGSVLADVEVADLGDFFVGERTRVWIPVAMKTVVSVPAAAVTTRAGVDYVTLASGIEVPVIIGQRFDDKGTPSVEILSGLGAGDTVVMP